MTAQRVLSVKNLSYTYPDGSQALDNISFNVYQGDCVALLGPNGAGKSTLLLHLNGILMCNGTGSVEVFGLKVEKKNLAAVRRKTGLVFQNPDDQLFCPTVFEDVAFGPRNMKLPEDEIKRRVRGSLNSVGLNGIEQKCSFHLSMGQKRRVAIATVLSMGAKLLALDEPTSSLDPKGRKEITELLKKIGGTQIIITHDLELARDVCGKAIILHGGRIAAHGDTQEILNDKGLLERHDLL